MPDELSMLIPIMPTIAATPDSILPINSNVAAVPHIANPMMKRVFIIAKPSASRIASWALSPSLRPCGPFSEKWTCSGRAMNRALASLPFFDLDQRGIRQGHPLLLLTSYGPPFIDSEGASGCRSVEGPGRADVPTTNPNPLSTWTGLRELAFMRTAADAA